MQQEATTTPMLDLAQQTPNKIDLIGILEQVLFGLSAQRWLDLPDDPKPDLFEYHKQCLSHAFGSAFFSGSLGSYSVEQVESAYTALTGKALDLFE